MSQLHLSDEILMAFADGELDEPVASAVEQVMLVDPTVTRRIADFLRSRRLTRSAFSRERLPEVSPELRAAVLAQIDAFAGTDDPPAKPETPVGEHRTRRDTWFSLNGALAASVAALAIASASYFVGQHQALPTRPASLVAQLDDAPVQDALSTVASGQDVALPLGRMRVISTYRLANGSLCREFRLQGSAGAAAAVACRNGDWNVTFAMAGPEGTAAYTPSSGGDLVTAYLQDAGAGEPLVDAAETKALAESSR
jgi:anti-sigma factor RsiW